MHILKHTTFDEQRVNMQLSNVLSQQVDMVLEMEVYRLNWERTGEISFIYNTITSQLIRSNTCSLTTFFKAMFSSIYSNSAWVLNLKASLLLRFGLPVKRSLRRLPAVITRKNSKTLVLTKHYQNYLCSYTSLYTSTTSLRKYKIWFQSTCNIGHLRR